VRGQLLNKFQHPLQGADVGVLFEDGSGNIIGGGSASASGPLSLGAREAFEMFGSFSAVPYANVAAVRISAIPSYA
jgi:hypothetical protein